MKNTLKKLVIGGIIILGISGCATPSRRELPPQTGYTPGNETERRYEERRNEEYTRDNSLGLFADFLKEYNSRK